MDFVQFNNNCTQRVLPIHTKYEILSMNTSHNYSFYLMVFKNKNKKNATLVKNLLS